MQSFIRVMRLMTLVYIAGAFLFFFLTPQVTAILGMTPAVDQFWVTLAVSMMAMLAYLSWQAANHPGEKHFVYTHLLAKVVSVAGFLFCYLVHQKLNAYLVGVITDSLVILVVVFFYRRINDVVAK